MANAFSDYMEAQILNWFKGTSIVASPSTLYVGLMTALPADTGTAGAPADGTEASGTSYARVAVTSASGWSALSVVNSTQQHITNSGTITFPQAGGSWGTIIGYGIYSASTAGNLICYGSVTSQAITTGMTPSFAAGQIDIAVD